MSSLLFDLRCKTVNIFTDNFHTWYGKEPPCRLSKKYLDSQEHALVCDISVKELTENQNKILNRTKLSDIFGNVGEQESITKMYQIIISIRDKILSSWIIRDQTDTEYLVYGNKYIYYTECHYILYLYLSE